MKLDIGNGHVKRTCERGKQKITKRKFKTETLNGNIKCDAEREWQESERWCWWWWRRRCEH